MRILFFTLCTVFSLFCNAQYIGVRAKYTATRLVDDYPNPPKRENRLILSFYAVSSSGLYTPTTVRDYDIWVYKQGLQYGNVMGGVLDSTGNNTPGYAYTAPKVVSYYNTLGTSYIDCDPTIATHYVANGHELDCGFVTVSYWDMDYGTMVPFEAFPAPNICLPYYPVEHPYFFSPGNVNFGYGTIFPGAPYNLYNFSCGGSLQLVMRGLLPTDTSNSSVVLPIRFAHVNATIDVAGNVTVNWSNMTESDINQYEVEFSSDGIFFSTVGVQQPISNNGNRADYSFTSIQQSEKGYYRIKAVESSGNSLYSIVVFVRRAQSVSSLSTALSIYPNPGYGSAITIRVSNAPAGRYVCSFINTSGVQVKHKMIEHSSGDLVRSIEMNDMNPGVYQVVIWSSTNRFTQKLVYGR